MPDAQNTPDGVIPASLAPDDGVVIPRVAYAEQGVTGLRTSNGRIVAEQQAAFRYPQFIYTVREMRNNPTIGAAMNVWQMMINRVDWDVVAPPGASEKTKQRALCVKSMMSDMDHSWTSFMSEVIPYLEYGFKPFEIVPRRRLRRMGSKFNDGVRGIKKLAPRNPETIAAWRYSEDGNNLLYLEQSLANTENQQVFQSRKDPATGNLILDREKLVIFSASPTNGNPEGNSIFKNIYLAHKQLTLLQEQELLGIAKDVQGILKIGVPPKYLDPNGSDSDKASAAAFQAIIDNYNAGKQRGLLVPLMVDPESKQHLFQYELMESKGTAKYDTEAVIKRLQGDIQQALCVDVLRLGAEGSGSYSLAESKQSILALAIDYRLREIKEALNTQLMCWIYQQNGWDMSEMCEFTYLDVESIDLDTFSKAVQRITSVNAIEIDRSFMNRVRTALGIDERDADEEVDKEALPAAMAGTKSSAGEGMAVGTTGNGTATNAVNGGEDTSTSNTENT